MRILLVDNAVDSLKIAMRTFDLWDGQGKKDSFRPLKITIEFLHNTMELLLKALLIEQDETSIYCENQEDLIEYAKENSRKENIPLVENIIKDARIKTLDYSELLKKYYTYNRYMSEKSKDSLKKLGIYRNRIMHLGIDATEDFADLLAVIYECFILLIEDRFYDDLLDLSEYFSYYDVLDTIEPWKELAGDALRELSSTIPSRKLNVFDEMMEKVIVSNKFREFLSFHNIILKDESVYEDDNINLIFQYNDKILELVTFYEALYNYSIVVQYVIGYPIVFSIMHFEEKICVYNKTIEYDEYEIDSLHEAKNRESVKIKPLTENNIRNCIVETLKKTILCETWENNEI